ncbi:type III restriction enzyme [Thermodesulfitimonas autotrophica]|uniref:Type III restriction enzyme n=1 Tax=Thermodesulfitimonas autotrophica TaxID=1894989 RepID=A0A3N5AWY2_9THEO|nr:DEAD/DEAH box helicase family protein [Thermodesulfitimonas autotrophica]RPF49393.1 type III restriction enzyme [Thermodesulfitimonas autotrophica]
MLHQQRFRNEDLVLRVSHNVDPALFDIARYEPFIEALCGTRVYQKEAIRVVLRYFLGGRYANLRQLAEENFYSNDVLKERYATFRDMEHHLQLPDQLSCSIDLATATGKSYVMYGIARIMLAHGAIDRVLVLCPSRTIEKGLTEKFRQLSGDMTLKSLLPDDSRVRNPHIINGTESIVDGTICIENFHATLQHVKSSVRDSLKGKGERTLILNDEVHHVYNPTGKDLKRWKEFLLDPEFRFRYIAGFSGTCYIGDEYFADVIYRYSLRQAIEQGYVKAIDYVAEDTSTSQDEKFQKIYDNHLQNKTHFYRKVKPLTILVTRDIAACKRLTGDLINFLAQREEISTEEAAKKVLIVTSAREHEANVRVLEEVDRPDNPVEWITSVSMLTEGWDVQNVFQIVPHEERAFNSKLLIAQVLGRGLRIPDAYRGERPVVTVFNHDAWSSRIKHLVDEVMEIEKRVYSYPVTKSPDYNFTLYQIDYSKTQEIEEFPQTVEYEFTKGYITLVSQVPALERETTYVRATTGERRQKKTLVRYQMFTVDEVAEHIHAKLKAIDTEEGTSYAERYSFDWLRALIRESLRRVGETRDQVSEENRQRLQKAFGVVHRKASRSVRYRMTPNAVISINTANRKRNSVGIGSLRRGEATVFLDDNSLLLSDEETQVVLQAILDDEDLPRSAVHKIDNGFYFKTPLNVAIADHKPERDFIRQLTKPENATVIDSWVKSTDQEFYPIEYAWRKGEHPKRGYFNPDFFIKRGSHILVIEIKGDEELQEPSDENKAKYKAARQHFTTLNALQSEHIYHFHFLTPKDYDKFFKFVRDGNYNFVSELDVALDENGDR